MKGCNLSPKPSSGWLDQLACRLLARTANYFTQKRSLQCIEMQLANAVTFSCLLLYAAASASRSSWTVQSADGDVSVVLAHGTLVSITARNTTTSIASVSGMFLSASGVTISVADANSTAVPLLGGGVSFVRHVRFGTNTATIATSFTPEANAVGWALTVNGTSVALWSPSITVNLTAATPLPLIWLPWSRAQCSAAGAGHEECNGLLSPLQSVPSEYMENARGYYDYGSAIAVPIAAMLDNKTDSGFALSVAPADNLIQVAKMAMLAASDSVAASFLPGYRVSSDTTGLHLRFHITGTYHWPWHALMAACIVMAARIVMAACIVTKVTADLMHFQAHMRAPETCSESM